MCSVMVPEKHIADMNRREMDKHFKDVCDFADDTLEDRALLILEETLDGRLERQCLKVFNTQKSDNDTIIADQVPEMLELLRYQITNTELHFLLRKFKATDGFDMIPEKEITRREWLWLVGECEKMKQIYELINKEALEICYETMIANLEAQKAAGLEGTDEWPHIHPVGPGWFLYGGKKPGYEGPLKPYVWGQAPEIEEVEGVPMKKELREQRKKRYYDELARKKAGEAAGVLATEE